MKFSYKVDGQYLLKSISIPARSGTISLITGTENNNTNILGGILAGVIPANASVKISEIKALIENYTGSLEIEDDAFPKPIIYLSADPDRHLLFSTVTEELFVRAGRGNLKDKLITFGLNESFLSRRIDYLSGGEKMKVALAAAFAVPAKCCVLHGVIPWLDKYGRKLLITKLLELQKHWATIIFLEQEIEDLLPIADAIYEFDGKNLTPIEKELFKTKHDAFFQLGQNKIATGCFSTPEVETLLEFQNITLKFHPFSEKIIGEPILDDISIRIFKNCSYCLMGDNGVGKSTLAQMVFRLFKPHLGKIFLQKRPLQEYTREAVNDLICYVGQFPSQQLTLSAVQQYYEKMKSNSNDFAISLMDRYLGADGNVPVGALSVLQTKLLCLFNGLSETTKILILDEPTWGIDKEGFQTILNIIFAIAQHQKITLFTISHDINFARALNAKILKLQNGKIIENN